jgi:hypothetical protein
MPVIINEFEVVAETPSHEERGGGGESQGDEAAQAQGPTPQDIERIIRHELERVARVRAH